MNANRKQIAVAVVCLQLTFIYCNLLAVSIHFVVGWLYVFIVGGHVVLPWSICRIFCALPELSSHHSTFIVKLSIAPPPPSPLAEGLEPPLITHIDSITRADPRCWTGTLFQGAVSWVPKSSFSYRPFLFLFFLTKPWEKLRRSVVIKSNQ